MKITYRYIQGRIVKKYLNKLFSSRRNLVLFVCAVALTLMVVFSGYALLHRGRVSDSDKAGDLARIETAVIAGLNKSNHLPESLHLEYLGLTNLKGDIDDYSY